MNLRITQDKIMRYLLVKYFIKIMVLETHEDVKVSSMTYTRILLFLNRLLNIITFHQISQN